MTIQQNIPLAPYTTFGIGGPADYFIVATTQAEIIDAVQFAHEKGLPFFMLGIGANILIGDKGYRGVVIKNEAKKVDLNGNTLTAESGALVMDLIQLTQEKGLSGLEHFAGIPSTVGGALWQNLHFLSPDRSRTVFIEEVLKSADIYTEEGERKTVGKDYFAFGYDTSILHSRHDIVLSATFILTPEDSHIIADRITANLHWRQEKHPKNATTSSAGSVFKKLDAYGAGRLIEKVGLKGKMIGGAKISDHHANFIINAGGAKADDVLSLIELVKKTVKEQLGLEMQPEISFVGEF